MTRRRKTYLTLFFKFVSVFLSFWNYHDHGLEYSDMNKVPRKRKKTEKWRKRKAVMVMIICVNKQNRCKKYKDCFFILFFSFACWHAKRKHKSWFHFTLMKRENAKREESNKTKMEKKEKTAKHPKTKSVGHCYFASPENNILKSLNAFKISSFMTFASLDSFDDLKLVTCTTNRSLPATTYETPYPSLCVGPNPPFARR